MSKFIIHGGKKLSGEVNVPGAKNEATKLVAAAILTGQNMVLENVPWILDFEKMLEIIQSMGAKVVKSGKHQVTLNCKNLNPAKINQKLVGDLRASSTIMGPLVAVYKKLKIAVPGGCSIGARPFDTHFDALRKLGVKIRGPQQNFYYLSAEKLKGAKIVLKEFSVTATETLVMAATLAQGTTIIKKAAAEPHVCDLIKCLNKMGACISWVGNHILKIKGVKKLSGVKHKVIPDMIDAGTFAVLAAATKSRLRINGFVEDHLESFLQVLDEFGVNFEVGKNYLDLKPNGAFRSVKKIETNIYPGLPTDLQQPLAVLATQANGPTLIFEKMFEGRFKYTSELRKMGANIFQANPHQIIINGPTPLHGTKVRSFDLRAGATMIIAGLLADGETIIQEAEMIDRGYEDITGRLQKIGADIKRVD